LLAQVIAHSDAGAWFSLWPSRESQVGIVDQLLRALEHAFAQSVNTAAVRLG
jgi:hypothetical protein